MFKVLPLGKQDVNYQLFQTVLNANHRMSFQGRKGHSITMSSKWFLQEVKGSSHCPGKICTNKENDKNRQIGFLTRVSLSLKPEMSLNTRQGQMSQYTICQHNKTNWSLNLQKNDWDPAMQMTVNLNGTLKTHNIHLNSTAIFL